MKESIENFCREDGLFHNQYFLIFFLLVFFLHLFVYTLLAISIIGDVRKGLIGSDLLPSYIPILVIYLVIWFHLYQITLISTELCISVVGVLTVLFFMFFVLESYKVLGHLGLRRVNSLLVYIEDVYIIHLALLLALKVILY